MIVTILEIIRDRAICWLPFWGDFEDHLGCVSLLSQNCETFFMQFCTYVYILAISCHKTEKMIMTHRFFQGYSELLYGSFLVFLHVLRNSDFAYHKCTDLLGITPVVTKQKSGLISFCLGRFGNILQYSILDYVLQIVQNHEFLCFMFV